MHSRAAKRTLDGQSHNLSMKMLAPCSRTTSLIVAEAPDPQVLEAARRGDEDAFRALVEPHRRELHAHCYRMLGSLQDAEDALQETLLRAWRGLGGFQDGKPLRPWLYTIATNASLDADREAAEAAAASRRQPPSRPEDGPGRPLTESSGSSRTRTSTSRSRTAAPHPTRATSSGRASSSRSSPRSSTCPRGSARC